MGRDLLRNASFWLLTCALLTSCGTADQVRPRVVGSFPADGQIVAGPVQEIRMGRIRAAIWENATTNGTRYNVTVSRIYKDGDTWKDSNSFGRDDLLIVAKVLDRCHTWIYSENGSAVVSNGEDGGEDAPF